MDNSRYSGRVIAALLLIGLGVMSLMGVGLLWPLFILVPGLLMLAGAFGGGRTGAAALAIPGMIITGTGALLFTQNLTGYWESWSYAWTLYGVFLGMGFMLMGQQFDDDSLHRVGRGFVNVSLVMFGIFAFFFEIVIGVSGRGPLNALILIGLGLFLMTRGGLGRWIRAALDQGSDDKPKRKVKTKHGEDKLFTGPIVVGTHVTSRHASRLSVSDMDDSPH
jgi:hypothetical protein